MRQHNSKISEADAIIGDNIATIRKIRGLSQTQMAESIYPPMRYQQISKYEGGYDRVAASTLVQIAKILKCSVSDFFMGTTEAIAQGGGFAPTRLNKREGQMITDYRALNPCLQQLVRQMTHAIVIETANRLKV